MDGFLNESEAGTCIVNFYKNITSQMEKEHCFCGERVGVLVQENSISEKDKDTKDNVDLLYSVGEIIHIGLNQATYLAAGEKVTSDDFMKSTVKVNENIKKKQDADIRRFVKNFIRNRGMLIYPNNPIYVNRVRENGLQHDILDTEHLEKNSFCLFHVMLRNLSYTNEIVVDISENNIHSLFWLGAAHGSDIYAIMVKHDTLSGNTSAHPKDGAKKERNVFDISGLWMAILQSYDTDRFYKQLAMVQKGIERHSKLIIDDPEYYEEQLKKIMSPIEYKSDFKSNDKFDGYSDSERVKNISDNTDSINENFAKLLSNKEREEKQKLESYYRRLFWNRMLRYNELSIYTPKFDRQENKGPRIYTSKWDMETISNISNYLSKRTVIGEYRFKSLSENEYDESSIKTNFISVGNDIRPLKKTSVSGDDENNSLTLTEVLADVKGVNTHRLDNHLIDDLCIKSGKSCQRMFKGFSLINKNQENSEEGLFTQHHTHECNTGKEGTAPVEIYSSKNQINASATAPCCLTDYNVHTQLAQLILWREPPTNNSSENFQVSIVGTSGPSTLGLSSIFFDNDQKKRYLKAMTKSALLVLCTSFREKYDVNLLENIVKN